MLLYELALELGVRSTALMDRAHALGINVSSTDPLTPEQVARLREAYGKARHAPQAPMAAPTDVVLGDKRPLSTGALLAVVGAGLVVVLLVAYMVTNSGGDDGGTTLASGDDVEAESTTTTEPCDPASGIGAGAIGQGTATTAAGATAEGALPPCDIAGGLSGDTIETSTTVAVDPIDVPRNTREFCKAAIASMEFDTKMIEAANLESLGPIRDVILQGRDKWRIDATVMSANAPPRLDVAMDRYVRVYTNLVDSVTPEADEYELAVVIMDTFRTDLNYYAAQINESINANCDKR
jgi:hypothetical protein